ncbi:MAG: glycosyltransferase family 4 protein [Thermoguttaceae bacterium]|jgi:UDP-GlcNAc:undecaprenyl-phosphate GlcNAc-1-phosphate transferase
MNTPLFYLFLVCVAAVTKIATEYYARWAQKHGVVDKADGLRKLQKAPTPVSGGVVIFAVAALATVIGVSYHNLAETASGTVPFTKIALILGAAFVLVLTGFLDDKNGMKGKRKLLLQLLTTSVIVGYARNYHSVEIFGHTIDLGHLFFPLALFWLVGFINAINLIDGADGVASVVGIMIFLSSGIIGVLHGPAYWTIAFLSFVMAAALFGFFLCNRPPAKIYLGDSGSMLIGFMAAVVLINACSVGHGTIRFCPAFAIAFLPILDSFSAIVRRTLAGRSIYFADRSHLHHRIQTHVGRNWTLLITLVLLQIPLSIGGIWGTLCDCVKNPYSDLIPLGAALSVLVFLIVTNIFGRNELKLMLLALKRLFCRIFFCPLREREPNRIRSFINLQEADWKTIWDSILQQTADYPCCFHVSLDINIPTMEVDFFVSKGERAIEKGIDADPRSIVALRMPLMLEKTNYCGNLFLQYEMLECGSKSVIELAEKLRDESVGAVEAFVRSRRQQDERLSGKSLHDETAKENMAKKSKRATARHGKPLCENDH